MKQNHPGTDICIPVKLTDGRYSIVIIQIKNISIIIDKDYPYPSSAKPKLVFDSV